MKKMLKLLKMMKNRPLIDVWYYLQGNYRYYFWYGGKWSEKYELIASLRKRMIRSHIKEQIEYRIKWMDKICYNNGECKLCGCQTLHLQMSDKSCDKPCYPPMMTKFEWGNWWQYGEYATKGRKIIWHRDPDGKPFIYFKA